MHRFTPSKILAIVVITALVITSCINENDSNQTAYGDAFIKAIQINDSTVNYKLQLYAYSWSEMSSVSVYSEYDATLIPLDTLDYKYTYAFQPTEQENLQQPPKEGEYFFKVRFENGEEYIARDYLMASFINPPQIDSLIWDDKEKFIHLKWNEVENARLYSVILLDENDRIVFDTDLMESITTDIRINQFTQGWYTNQKPNETSTYKVVLSAYLFEPNFTTFDLQCIAVNDLYSFTWNLDR